MRLGLVLSATIAAVLLPIICHASESEGHGPGYDFVEAGWSWLDAGHDGDGFAANVSVSVSEPLFFYGNGTFVNFKYGAGSADSLRNGLGFYISLNDSWVFVIRGAAQHIDEGHKSYGVQGCMIRIGA